MCLIYMAVNINNHKIYIGKTKDNISRRRARHYYEARKRINKSHFHKALRAYDASVFEWDVLEDNISIEDLSDTEIFWITYLRYIGADLYNHSNGGGGYGYKHTEETRLKMSLKHTGKKLSESHKQKLKEYSEARKGVPRSEETKMKISEANKGKKRTEEQRRNISEAHKGWKMPEEQKKRISESCRRSKNEKRQGV